MRQGFFTRQEATRGVKRGAVSTRGVSVETLHRLGSAGAKNMNSEAENHNLAPRGPKQADVYVLGYHPTIEDDEKGKSFSSASGLAVIKALRAGGVTKPRCSYVVRTVPPAGRGPTWQEVEMFRPETVADIERTKPKALVLLGGAVGSWAMPGVGKDDATRGRRFPVRVGSHVCWAYPVHSYQFVRMAMNMREINDAPGEAWLEQWHKDLAQAAKGCKAVPRPVDAAELFDGVRLFTERKQFSQLVFCIRQAAKYPCTVDIETNCLRPYARGAALMSIALTYCETTLAFPIDHPDSPWTSKQRVQIKREMRKWMRSKATKAAHNYQFECEWLLWWLGYDCARKQSWHDTMLAAYVLDERQGGLSLEFCCWWYLGFDLKAQSKIDVKRLADEPLEDVLRYNALDAKYTHALVPKMLRDVKRQGLARIYKVQLERVPTLVLAQARGMPVRQKTTAKLQAKFERVIAKTEKELARLPEVRRFAKRNGKFVVSKNEHCTTLFRDILGRKEGVRGDKYSTDAEVLSSMKGLEAAELVLRYREYAKLKSTYVDRMVQGHPNSFVYPDGRIHVNLRTTNTRSGRLASDDPNGQNFPKRSHPEVRAQIVAEPGTVMLAADYGQIEARVMGAASQDDYLCKALWEGYDIHMAFAERVAAVHPATLRRYGDMKTLRSELKNKFVFPLFYGAHGPYVCRMLELPQRVGLKLCEEFWDTFAGVASWQKQVLRDYDKYGYVESLSGRRRRGPLTDNQKLNTPVQGGSSDIVVDAMNRLSIAAQEEDDPYLQAVLNIHDDLTFFVPKEHVDRYVDRIAREMLAVPFSWVTVPMQVEIATGPNWFQLEDIGKWESHKLN